MNQSAEPVRVMLDIETLGLAPGSAILEISARTFSVATGQLGHPCTLEIDLLDSIACGFSVDQETAQWHLAKSYAGHLRGKPVRLAMESLASWLAITKPAEVWAWGIDFERSHLSAACRRVDLDPETLWPYYASRDARTLWHTVFPTEKPTPKIHRAEEDVAIQCRDIIRCLIALHP